MAYKWPPSSPSEPFWVVTMPLYYSITFARFLTQGTVTIYNTSLVLFVPANCLIFTIILLIFHWQEVAGVMLEY